MTYDPKTTDLHPHIGASWYPQMWPESEWPGDVANIRQLGFTLTRVPEFAWHRLEPRGGEFDLDWALRMMDLCHQARLAVPDPIGYPGLRPTPN